MAWIRGASIAVAGAVVAAGLAAATFTDVAQAQRQPQASPTPVAGQQQQQQGQGQQDRQGQRRQQPGQQQAQGAATLGNVVDQLFATSALLEAVTDRGQLQELLQARTQGPNQQARMVFLNGPVAELSSG
ncbi:MAG: hypothetical protein M3O34_02530, partial [Chloroflexota bacterium]|nr:hypothetical protein [Chloroflexota bacterium]